MTLRLLLAFLVLSPVASAAPKKIAKAAPTAEQMMIDAHKARAEWKDLPGFAADVLVRSGVTGKENTEQTARGGIKVDSAGTVEFDLPEKKWLSGALGRIRSIVAHRMPGDEKKYDVRFANDSDVHPYGRLIRFNNDRFHSEYRIQGDLIREVHRTQGEVRFTITVIDITRNKSGKILPKTYTVSFWKKSGELMSSHVTRLEWTRVGKFDLPKTITTVKTSGQGSREVQQISFTKHKLVRE